MTARPARGPLPAEQVVLGTALARPARLGASRLVCVDGPSGSGKTTLADRLAALAGDWRKSVGVVHLDDVYAGWSGLDTVGDLLRRSVVEPLGAGQPGRFRRWDWHRSGRAEEVVVPVVDLLILEGVGSGHPGFAEHVSVLVWVQAPADLRLQRGLARDGADLLPRLQDWAVAERDLHERERTRERADLVVDGVTGTVTVPISGRSGR